MSKRVILSRVIELTGNEDQIRQKEYWFNLCVEALVLASDKDVLFFKGFARYMLKMLQVQPEIYGLEKDEPDLCLDTQVVDRRG